MSVIAPTVLGLVSVGLLVYAGIQHAMHSADFRLAIREQSLIPERLASAAAWTTSLAEMACGFAGLVLIITSPGGSLLQLTLGIVASVYFVFAAYAAMLLRARPMAPCGCSNDGHPVNVWAVIRALVLATAAVVSAYMASQITPPDMDMNGAILSISVLTLAVIVWVAPSALSDPLKLSYVRSRLKVET